MNKLVSQDLTPQQYKEMYDNLTIKEWRMNNLYWIKNKQGIVVLYHKNFIQDKIFSSYHPRKIIVKNRQSGVSKGFLYDYIDTAIFNENIAIGIIAHKLEVAGDFLDALRLAYDRLPDIIKSYCPLTSDVKAREMAFNNGSSIYVSTSFRGKSVQILHLSEMAYICKKNPDKAKEIVTGALESVAVGQQVNIESTAMGNEGFYATQVDIAKKKKQEGKSLSQLDYELFFFPWMDDPTCVLKDEDIEKVEIYPRHLDYFAKIESQTGYKITPNQRAFYVMKESSLGEDIFQEYPSTLEESFWYSLEGTYYADQFTFLRTNNRICSVPYQEGALVDVAWDIGLDGSALWFCQTIGREQHIIDYLCFEDLSFGLIYDEVMKKKYRLGTHILPHDSESRMQNTGLSKLETILNIFQTRNFFLVPPPSRISRADGIGAAKNYFSLCWFDRMNCSDGLDMLENYSKTWNSSLGRYIDTEPRHTKESHPADSWRHLAIYKMLMMKIGNRQDRQTMNEVMKNPKKTMQGGFKGFI